MLSLLHKKVVSDRRFACQGPVCIKQNPCQNFFIEETQVVTFLLEGALPERGAANGSAALCWGRHAGCGSELTGVATQGRGSWTQDPSSENIAESQGVTGGPLGTRSEVQTGAGEGNRTPVISLGS